MQSLQFKDTGNGKKIFYPFGIMGKGVVLDEQGTLLLQNGARWSNIINFLFFALLSISLLFPAWLNIVAIGYIFSHMTKKFLIVRHYPRTSEALTLAQSSKDCAEIFSMGTVITVLLITSILFLGSIYVILTDAVGEDVAIADFIGNVLSLIIFGVAAYIASLMLIAKINTAQRSR